jgi:polyphenol oxidase
MRSEAPVPAGLVPDWGAPAGVGAWMSTRQGGVSAAPWAGLNLGTAVGDDPAAVAENRRRFAAATAARPVFLRQVHGCTVVELSAADAERAQPLEADAAVTTQPGVACTVQVADCLPVLLAADNGRAVAAAHAGWRGLAAGVVDAALAALCRHAGCAPADVHAWLGPCIGPQAFEVGADVLAGFQAAALPLDQPRFAWCPRPNGEPRWLADLPGLARDRLQALGVGRVSGGDWCTVRDASSFFSFRRDGVTGRMAAAVWLRA